MALQSRMRPVAAAGPAASGAGCKTREGAHCAIFDFGDGLVGPREYDWLGPLCFLAAGDAQRIDAFFEGYHGRAFDRDRHEGLMRLLLLRRYSHLGAQLAVPGSQAASDFRALAALVCP